MQNNNSYDLAYYLSRYFAVHLPGERGFSSNTIASYRDTFKQLLLYFQTEKNISPDKMKIEYLTTTDIRGFMNYLESTGKTVSTRNQRLAAIKGFMRYLQFVEPKFLILSQQILSVQAKKCSEATVSFTGTEGIAAILAQPNTLTRDGYRDMLLMALLYDSGARVSEIAKVRIEDLRLVEPCTISLNGKGRKKRIVPLSLKTAKLISCYLYKERLTLPEHRCRLLFTNRQGTQFTRAGIAYILSKYVKQVQNANPALGLADLSPHCFRHSKAMHLLQAGVPLIYIRDFLGHSQIKTTEIYAKADSEAKRRALERAYPLLEPDLKTMENSWTEDEGLIKWLESLCR